MPRRLALLTSTALLALAACSSTPRQPEPLTSLHLAGHTAQTAVFAARGPWTLTYRYDCSAMHKPAPITITDNGRVLLNESDIAGFGVSMQTTTGTQRLEVSSTCSWVVDVSRN